MECHGGAGRGDRAKVSCWGGSGQCARGVPARVVVLARSGFLPIHNRSQVSLELGASTALFYASRKADGHAVRSGNHPVRERVVASRVLPEACWEKRAPADLENAGGRGLPGGR